MPTEPEPTEMVTTEQPPETDGTTQQPSGTEMVQVSKSELEKMQKALADANREAAKRRKELDAAAEEKRKRDEAEMTELQKAQKRAAELEGELAQRDLNDKKRAIAAKVGLPEALALRLEGKDDEELEADAKKILEALPRAEKPKSTFSPTNPGANGSTGKTDAQRLRELGLM